MTSQQRSESGMFLFQGGITHLKVELDVIAFEHIGDYTDVLHDTAEDAAGVKDSH